MRRCACRVLKGKPSCRRESWEKERRSGVRFFKEAVQVLHYLRKFICRKGAV